MKPEIIKIDGKDTEVIKYYDIQHQQNDGKWVFSNKDNIAAPSLKYADFNIPEEWGMARAFTTAKKALKGMFAMAEVCKERKQSYTFRVVKCIKVKRIIEPDFELHTLGKNT